MSTVIELAADPSDLQPAQAIRDAFGSRAQTIINMLLSFDAYLNWYFPFKASIPFMCEMELREERAFDNMRRATDMMEIFERASIRNHGSYLIHGAIFKTSRDNITVGDVWAVDLSPLELQNAETKRVAATGGTKHLTITTGVVEKRAPKLKLTEGPQQLVQAKGYSSSMSSSTLKNLLAAQHLRRGDGLYAFKDSRRKERLLFGEGRTKPKKVGESIAFLSRSDGYNPVEDSCLSAFVRMVLSGSDNATPTAN